MSLISRVMSAALQLPPAQTRDLLFERDLEVPMSDGTVLRADRYAPRGSTGLPVVLIRSPYGRKGLLAELWAKPFAERGFQAVIQSVRGTFGSAGRFDPHHHERADGLATLSWIKQQPWFGDSIFTFGQSYLGYTQWAIARDAGPELKALAIQISTAHFANMTYAGGSFSLRNALGWSRIVTHQENPLAPLFAARELGAIGDPLRAVWRKRPMLAQADVLAAGRHVQFFQDWLKYASPDDPWWRPLDFQRSLAEVDKPMSLVAGWDDIFLPWQLQDFSILQDAGRDVQLVVGPWKHLDAPVNAYGIRQALELFRAQLTGDRSQRRAPVRVYVTGANAFRDFDRWPPREARIERFYLQPGAALSPQLSAASAPDCYTYNPDDPTPALGGPSLTLDPVRVDNRALEARSDVLKYTSGPLPRDLDVIGPVTAELWVQSDRETCDVFVRLCDVSPDGQSQNVCDGLKRVRFESRGVQRVIVTLWPTAHRFKAGRRLRLQVSGGAYPRWAINPGVVDALAGSTPRVPQRQQIFHGPEHPSALALSVV